MSKRWAICCAAFSLFVLIRSADLNITSWCLELVGQEISLKLDADTPGQVVWGKAVSQHSLCRMSGSRAMTLPSRTRTESESRSMYAAARTILMKEETDGVSGPSMHTGNVRHNYTWDWSEQF